jgi:hypothetical protein
MFRKLIKNKKAQNTAEYAILISLVVAGIIAMQTYAQRALQGRVRAASQFMTTQTNGIGNTVQYEPYYLTTDYNVITDDTSTQLYDNISTSTEQDTLTTRKKQGSQVSSYSTALGLINGL